VLVRHANGLRRNAGIGRRTAACGDQWRAEGPHGDVLRDYGLHQSKRAARHLALGQGFRGAHPVISTIRLRRSAMNAIPGLTLGLKGSAELVIGEQHTAPKVGSGRVHVLATPVMINLIEAAALAAVERLLPPGQQSLGTHLDVRHFAATPVGMRVSAEAELIKIDGRLLTFRVSAADAIEPIGDGTHERVVVTLARFDQRVQKKAAQIP
jgi:predicted thioesterase